MVENLVHCPFKVNKQLHYCLKGQCHEMVIEMIPWSSSLGLTNGRGPFFLFENSVLKRQSVEYHIHRCKNWFSRSGGFCYDSASISPTVAIRSMVGATVGISRPSQRGMPRNFARYATAGRFWRILLQLGS
jgi:hypothetical protein